MKRRVLVTGAAGNIGSMVMRELTEEFDMTGLDVVPTPTTASVDLADYESLLPWVAEMDTVVHLGADPNPNATWESVLHNNIIGTRNVYAAAAASGVRRVVFASSHQSTLGWELDEPWATVLQGEGQPAEFRPLDSTIAFRPSGDYGASKAWGEVQGRAYAEHQGLSVICLRFTYCTRDGVPPTEFSGRWLSRGDAARSIRAAINASDALRFGVYYIVSANANMIFDQEAARRDLDYMALDGVRDHG